MGINISKTKADCYFTLVVCWLFPRLRVFWENVWPFNPCLRFFFFWVETSSRKLIPLSRPGSVHSGSASWDDYGWVFPDKLPVSSFPGSFPHYAWTVAQSSHSGFVGSRVYACLGVTCHLHFWQDDRGLLRATALTRDWNGHRIRVSTQSELSRRTFSRHSRRDSNSQPFNHEFNAKTINYPNYLLLLL